MGLIGVVGGLLLQQAASLHPTALVIAVGFGLGRIVPSIGKFLDHRARRGHGIAGRLAHPAV